MKKITVLMAMMFTLALTARGGDVQPQGMQGQCKMCGTSWDGKFDEQLIVPKKLPKPKSAEWIKGLRELLSLERLSVRQYEADNKGLTDTVFTKIIYRKNFHSKWIAKLLSSYGLSNKSKTLNVIRHVDTAMAYEYAAATESEIARRCESLGKDAPDEDTRLILETILMRARMHYAMIESALKT